MLLFCFSSHTRFPSFTGHCRQEHIRQLAGDVAPGTSLRLEIPKTQRQVLVTAVPPDCMDEALLASVIPEDTGHGVPDLGRLEMQQASPLGSALRGPGKAPRWLLLQLFDILFVQSAAQD